jgi:hypothetical protein
MRTFPLPLLSGVALATAVILTAAPPARAWITQTTDNSPTPTPWLPPQWWRWGRAKPKAPAPACRSKYCPPYYSETHGYTPPQWRPWPGTEPKMTAAPKADVNPPAQGSGTTNTTPAPTSLPEAVETSMPRK